MSLDTYLNIVQALETSPMFLMGMEHLGKHVERFAYVMNRQMLVLFFPFGGS